MLAVVKRPRIEIRAKHIPAPLVRFLKDTYKPENVIVSDEDVAVPFEESEWFKTLETTPAEMIVANRDLRNWSQVTLAEKLGIQVQNLCAMENGRRTVRPPHRRAAVSERSVHGWRRLCDAHQRGDQRTDARADGG